MYVYQLNLATRMERENEWFEKEKFVPKKMMKIPRKSGVIEIIQNLFYVKSLGGTPCYWRILSLIISLLNM